MTVASNKPAPARIMVRARRGAEELGFSQNTYWRTARRDPTFPTAHRLTSGTTTWYLDEIQSWRDAHRVAKATPAEPAKQKLEDQLRALLAGRGSMIELVPGGGSWLLTLPAAPAAASQTTEAAG